MGDVLDPRDQVVHLRDVTVELDDRQGLRVHRVAGVAEFLDGMDRGFVHHLHAAGNDPRGDDVGHEPAAVFDIGESDQDRPGDLRFLEDPHRHLGDDAQQAFRPRHHAHQVVALRVEMLAAQADDLAVHEDDFETQDVVGRDAVLQAMDAAGVLGDVSADRAHDLARGVGRVVEAFIRHGLADGQVGNARLHDRAAVLVVDLQDTVELPEAEEHPVGQRQGAPGEGRARAPGNHLGAVFGADLEDPRHLPRVFRERDGERDLSVGGQAVALVGLELVVAPDHALFGQHAAEGGDERTPPRDDVGVGFRHSHDPLPPAGVAARSGSRDRTTKNRARGAVRTGRPRASRLTLPRLESPVRLVDHVHAAAAAHHPTVAVPPLRGLQ